MVHLSIDRLTQRKAKNDPQNAITVVPLPRPGSKAQLLAGEQSLIRLMAGLGFNEPSEEPAA